MNTRFASVANTGAAALAGRGARSNPLFRLAWRNVWRHKRRTILLVLVVAYATLATVFFWGYVEGVTESILSNQARLLLAPALITTATYVNDPDPQNALPTLDFVASIEGRPGVHRTAPRLEFFALLRSPYTSESAMVRGIEPALEPAVSDLPQHIEGQMLEQRGEVVLGAELARRLDVRLGERLAMDASALAGPQAAGLRVVGLLNSGLATVDRSVVLVHIDDARALTGVETATGIALDVPRGREDAVAERLQEHLPEGLEARGIMALLGPMRQEIEANRISMIPIGLLFAVFAALAVTSTVLVSVLERKRELGMMAAIGLAPPKLSSMVVLESVLATASGWVVGLVIGYGLLWIFGTWNILGAAFGTISEAFADWGLGNELYTTSHPVYALYAAATIVLAALFAMLIPARNVAKLNPVEAMRTE